MNYYTVKDVQKILGISSSKAYQVMRQLNNELKTKGYIVIAGKVPKKYFGEKYYCDTEDLRMVVGK
jgi:sugar-specific transcriptional regulator TrmB